ncbi:MAG: lysyl oxidase family protein [Acidimicrobiales bacterium]
MAAGGRLARVVSGVAVLAALALTPLPSTAAVAPPLCGTPAEIEAAGGRLPDMRTVVPQHLNLVNEHQREILRFSNLIANTGAGPWRLRPEFPLEGTATDARQQAIQQVLDSEDSSGDVVCEELVSEFAYHPTHRHWHTDGVALFEIRVGSPDGEVFENDRGARTSVKTTFCLIDWVKLIGSSTSGKDTTRTYFDCLGPFHGVSVGWADQYHHATDGQDLDITGVAPGEEYFLVSVTDADGRFLESDPGNNGAWQGFRVSRDSKGNPKITLTSHSTCDATLGLCGGQKANR